MNMPAEERVAAYETTDFAAMRLHVFGWVSQVCYFVGLSEVDPDVPIMFSMQDLEVCFVTYYPRARLLTLVSGLRLASRYCCCWSPLCNSCFVYAL